MIEVRIPHKNAIAEFPDNTPPEVIQAAIKKQFYAPSVMDRVKQGASDVMDTVSPYLKRDVPPQELPSRPVSSQEAKSMEGITDIARVPLNLATGVASFLNPVKGVAGIYEGAKKLAEGVSSGIGTMAGGGAKWEEVPSADKVLQEANRGVTEGREAEEQALEMMGKVLPLGEPKTEIGKTVEGGIGKALEVVFKEPAEYWASKVNPEKHPNLAATIATFMEIAPLALPLLKKGLKKQRVLKVVNDITDKTNKGVDITPEEAQTLKTDIEALKTEASKPIETEPLKPQGDVTSRMGEKFNAISMSEAGEMLKNKDPRFVEELKSAVQEKGRTEAEHITRNLESIVVGGTPKAERPQVINNIKELKPQINEVLEAKPEIPQAGKGIGGGIFEPEIYKVETGTKVKWFKTKQGADKYASQFEGWKAEIPKDAIENEWGKLQLKMPNNFSRLSERASPLKVEQGKVLHDNEVVTPKETTNILNKASDKGVLKEQKAYLLSEIDKVIENAPDNIDIKYKTRKVVTEEGYGSRTEELNVVDLENTPHIEIEVPNDGTFTIPNSKAELIKFRDKIKSQFPTKATEGEKKYYTEPSATQTKDKITPLENGFTIKVSPKETWHTNGHILLKGEPSIKFKSIHAERQEAFGSGEKARKTINEVIPKDAKEKIIDVDYFVTDPSIEGVGKEPFGKGSAENRYVRVTGEKGNTADLNQELYKYALKHYPDAEFFMKDNKTGIVIKSKGETVGTVMPMRDISFPEHLKTDKSILKSEQGGVSLDTEISKVSKTVDDFIGDVTPQAGLSVKDISGVKPTNDIILSPKELMFENKEAEFAWRKAEGIGKPSIHSKAINLAVKIKNSFTRHFPLLDIKKDGAVMDTLRIYEATPEIVKEKTLHILQGITAGLGKNKYSVFSKNIILPDLIDSVEGGLYEGKNLPFRFKNLEEIKTEYTRFKRIAENNPSITEALNKRKEFIDVLTKELVTEGFLPNEVLQNKNYFHRQVLDYIRLKEAYTKTSSGDVRIHTKGWQKKRMGSELDYNTQYLEAEFEVISQALSQLKTKQTLTKLESMADVSPTLKKRAEQQGIENWKDLIPEDHTLWQPKEGNTFYRALTIPEKILDDVLSGAKEINKADLKEILALGVKRKEWVIPKRLAKTLDNFRNFEDKNILHSVNDALLNSWKQWTLLNPVRVIKYNLNNLSGDFDIAFAYNPKIIKYVPQAIRESYVHLKGKSMSKDMVEFSDRGGLSSGITIKEIPDISEQGIFKLLTGDNPNIIEKYWTNVKEYTQFRENILRLAAYKFFKAERVSGKRLYGVSKKVEIDAIKNSLDVDAKMARELIGDYGNISEAGNYIRKHLIPFYSWIEINSPRYVRLFKNAAHENRKAGVGGRMVGVATKKGVFATAKGIAALIPTTLAFYTLTDIWNKTMFSDEEKELGDAQRKQKHLIIGKREDGTIQTIRLQGALSDMLEWVNLADIPNDVSDVMAHGIDSLKDKAREAAFAPVQRISNAIWPIQKVIGEAMIGKTIYPDITKPRPIRDSAEHIARFLSVDMPYRYLTGKPTRGISNDISNILTYSTDVGEASYYDTAALVNKYREKNNIEKPMIEPTAKSNALYYIHQARKYKDTDAIKKYAKIYSELGGTTKGYDKSIEMRVPMYGLKPNQTIDFISKLSPEEKERVIRGIDWYHKTYKKKGK